LVLLDGSVYSRVNFYVVGFVMIWFVALHEPNVEDCADVSVSRRIHRIRLQGCSHHFEYSLYSSALTSAI